MSEDDTKEEAIEVNLSLHLDFREYLEMTPDWREQAKFAMEKAGRRKIIDILVKNYRENNKE